MGDSPKWFKSRRRRKKEKKERAKAGDNNGQAMHGCTQARMAHARRTQAAWAKILTKRPPRKSDNAEKRISKIMEVQRINKSVVMETKKQNS